MTLNENTTNELARKLRGEVFAAPEKPVHKMSQVEYGQQRRAELARELLFWLAGRTGDMETFVGFPTKGMHERLDTVATLRKFRRDHDKRCGDRKCDCEACVSADGIIERYDGGK